VNCYAFNSVLDYFWDGRLLPDLESKIKSHSDSCLRCEKKITAHAAYRKILRQEVFLSTNIEIPAVSGAEKTISLRDWFEQPAEGFSLAYGIALVCFFLNPLLSLASVGVGILFQ